MDIVDDPSPESLNAQQNAVGQPSNAVKEVGYEDNTNNREIIQDAVAFQMDPVNTSTSGIPANGNEVETIEMVGDGCCGPSSGCCNPYLTYTILVNILAIIGAVLSIVAVSTCQFLKIKNDSPWFGLLGWGRHQWDDQCRVDFQYWRCEEYDLEDDFGLAARIFGIIAAVVGIAIAVWTIISIFLFPRWTKILLTTSSFSNVLFQGLVFLVYGGEVCQEEKLEYCPWEFDDNYPIYYYQNSGKGCEFSSGAVCAVIAMISWLVLGILFIFRKPFSRKEAIESFHCCVFSKCCKPSPATSLNDLHSTVLNVNKIFKEEILADGTKNSITTYQPDLSEYRMTVEMVFPNGSKVTRNVEERFVPDDGTVRA